MLEHIKILRAETGLSIAKIRKVLETVDGDIDKARDLLPLMGAKSGELGAGRIATYVHHNGSLAALVGVSCATDFAANTDEFKDFTDKVAQQVAAFGDEGLLDQTWMFAADELKVSEAVNAFSAKLGEPVEISHTHRHLIKF